MAKNFPNLKKETYLGRGSTEALKQGKLKTYYLKNGKS